jgi:hypothetical protein
MTKKDASSGMLVSFIIVLLVYLPCEAFWVINNTESPKEVVIEAYISAYNGGAKQENVEAIPVTIFKKVLAPKQIAQTSPVSIKSMGIDVFWGTLESYKPEPGIQIIESRPERVAQWQEVGPERKVIKVGHMEIFSQPVVPPDSDGSDIDDTPYFKMTTINYVSTATGEKVFSSRQSKIIRNIPSKEITRYDHRRFKEFAAAEADTLPGLDGHAKPGTIGNQHVLVLHDRGDMFAIDLFYVPAVTEAMVRDLFTKNQDRKPETMFGDFLHEKAEKRKKRSITHVYYDVDTQEAVKKRLPSLSEITSDNLER